MGRMEEVHPKGFPFISFFLTSFDSLPAQKLSVTGSRIISLHLNHETPLVLIGNLPLKTAPAAFGPLCASTKQIPEKFKSSHRARLLFSPKSRFACECELWFLLKPGLATAVTNSHPSLWAQNIPGSQMPSSSTHRRLGGGERSAKDHSAATDTALSST